MKLNVIRSLYVIILLFIVTSVYGQKIKTFNVDNNGLAASFGVNGAYDKENALWYTNPTGLIKYVNNQSFFFPYAKKDDQDLVFQKARPLFISSTNEIFQAHKDHGIYRFNIDKEKGEWLDLEISKEYQTNIFEDDFRNLWFFTPHADIYKLNLLDNSSEKLVITQVKNQKFKDKDYQIHYAEGALRPYSIGNKVLFQKKDDFFYFENKKSIKLDIEEELLEIEDQQRIKISVAKLGDFYPFPISTTYFYKGKPHKIIFNKTLNCHFFQLPKISSLKNELNVNKVKNFEIVIPSENILNNVYNYKLVYKDGRILDFLELKKVNGRNELISSKSLTFSANIESLILGKEEITVFTGSTFEMISTVFPFFNKLLDNGESMTTIRPMVEATDGTIYIQTYLGLYKLKDNVLEYVRLKHDKADTFSHVHDMIIRDKTLWALSTKRLIKINLNNNEFEYYKLINCKGFNGNKKRIVFNYLEEIDKEKLLLASNFGLFEFNTKAGALKKCSRINKIVDIESSVSHLIKDDQKKYWIASDKGVLQIDKSYTILKKLSLDENVKPKLLFKTGANELKIVTYNNMLLTYNLLTDQVLEESYFKDNNYTIASVIKNNNDLWVSTYTGLIHYKTNNPDKKYKYTINHGLPDNEFNTNSFLKTKNNELLFGGMKGLIKFTKPPELNKKEDSLKIKLEKASMLTNKNPQEVYSKKLIKSTGEINLKIPVNSLDLFFSSNLGNLKSEKLKYYYRNLSLSEKWFNLDNSGLVRLYNLPNKKNTIQVKAQFNNLESNVLNYKITVRGAFYKETWFVILLILGILIGAGFTFFNKVNQKKFKEKSALKIKTLELQSLISQMNPHFLHNTINNLQSALISGKPELISEYFESFSVILRHTLRMSKLGAIELSDEIEYINSFLLISKMRLNGELLYSIDIPPDLPINKIKIPSLIIQPVIENAIIHGLKPKLGEKKLSIVFKQQNASLVVEITDNGIGREAAKINQENSVIKPHSMSSNILMERLNLMNIDDKDFISMKIEDLIPQNDKSYGTRVILEFKNLIYP